MNNYCKFSVLLEDGGIINNAILSCKKGVLRNKRDFNNALKWEGGILINGKLVKSHEIYHAEVV